MVESKDEEIARLQNQIKSMDEGFQKFVYTISHDVNAPIRTMVAFAELLEKQAGAQLDDKAKSYLNFIVNAGEKAGAMMAGLLEYSRLNTREKKLDKVDVGQVVKDVIIELEAKIKTSNAKVEIGNLPKITAYEDGIHKIFYCLLDNALKYHSLSEPPRINIYAKQQATGWQFFVEDNGIGIDERFSKDIFKVFRRLHRDTEYSGTGIGLAMAKKLVEEHGGQISVSSIPEKSAIFYFNIPDLISSTQLKELDISLSG